MPHRSLLIKQHINQSYQTVLDLHCCRWRLGVSEEIIVPPLRPWSHLLRTHVFSLDWIRTVKCVACCRGAPAPAIEVIELQGLPNGNALHL